MEDSANYIGQKSFTDHEPKWTRRYDGTHVNMANDMTDSYMAGTTISRHVGELVPLTTEQYMAWQGNPTVRRHICEAKHSNSKFKGFMDH